MSDFSELEDFIIDIDESVEPDDFVGLYMNIRGINSPNASASYFQIPLSSSGRIEISFQNELYHASLISRGKVLSDVSFETDSQLIEWLDGKNIDLDLQDEGTDYLKMINEIFAMAQDIKNLCVGGSDSRTDVTEIAKIHSQLKNIVDTKLSIRDKNKKGN